MTDEEIKQKAEVYANTLRIGGLSNSPKLIARVSFEEGAHSRGKEIEDLKEEIESLKENETELFEGFKKRGTKLGELMKENVKLHNPWVSVKERLPEDNKTVLVWFGGYYTVAVLRDDEWWNCTGYQTDGGWSALDKIPDIASSYITHWMPIPD